MGVQLHVGAGPEAVLWQLESARIDESAPRPLSSGRQHAQIRVSFPRPRRVRERRTEPLLFDSNSRNDNRERQPERLVGGFNVHKKRAGWFTGHFLWRVYFRGFDCSSQLLDWRTWLMHSCERT